MAAAEADLATLRAFIAAGGRFNVDAHGNPVAPDANAQPQAAGAAASVSPADLRAQRQAINAQREADRQTDRQAGQAEKQARFDAQRQARQQRDQERADQRRRATEERNAKTARAPFDALSSWVEGLPTPGGNLALLLIILFFAFAIIPVNGGATRLELIYLVLTGRADLPTNAAGTSGNTTTTTPNIGQVTAAAGNVIGGIATGVGTGIGLPPGILPGGGGSGGGSGSGPGVAIPTAQATAEYLAPARMGADW